MDSGKARRRGDRPEDAEVPVRPPPPVPPPERRAPSPADRLRAPRPEAGPGIWRRGHRPGGAAPPAGPAVRALAAAAACVLLCWQVWTGGLGTFLFRPLRPLADGTWGDGRPWAVAVVVYLYLALILAAIVALCARAGRWGDFRRHLQAAQQVRATQAPPPPDADPAGWPELRAGGAARAADRLGAELASGSLTDVDHARISRAWQCRDTRRPDAVAAFVREIAARGAAAFPHDSGARDLPARTAEHDLLLRQVRVGTAVDSAYNPRALRTAGIALDPGVLATSALVVGPRGAGGTGELVRPVAESLCLQALAGLAAVVLVTTETDAPLAEEAFDAVVRPEDPRTPYSLGLYATDDPDAAADDLADALLGNTATAPGGDDDRASTVLARLTGPFARVHGRLPGVPELRDLLGGDDTVRELRAALADLTDGSAYDAACLRGLDALLARRPRGPGDCRALLADGVALLDRPAFADFFTPSTAPSPARRPVPLGALDRPVRIRFDLPERRHPAASRILARLLLGQFARLAAARGDRDPFAFLVLDDAAQAVTVRTLEGLRRLRSAHAGALLTLRSLNDEVPWPLCRPLLDSVGCRVACARLSPPDARHFAGSWYSEFADYGAAGRIWTEYELATAVPLGFAVLSCADLHGRRTPPLLAALGR